MTRSRVWRLWVLGFCALPMLGAACMQGFSFSFTFVQPKRAESTETKTVSLAAGLGVQVLNEIGSTRITVDPNAPSVTIEIKRTAMAETQQDANDLLANMVVNIVEPTGDANVLVIEAKKPAGATDDNSQFQFTATEDEINVVAIVGAAKVVKYDLRITLPAGHPAALTQTVGQVRLIALDSPSTVVANAGDVRSMGGTASLGIETKAGYIEAKGHRGSLNLKTTSGYVAMEIVALVSSDTVAAKTKIGGISIKLPEDINANLKAWTESGYVNFRARDFSSTTGTVVDTRSYVEAALGSGGAKVELQSEMGEITVQSY